MWFSEIRSDKKLVDPRKESRKRDAVKVGEYNAEAAKESKSIGFL
jgi:hypothetical protein